MGFPKTTDKGARGSSALTTCAGGGSFLPASRIVLVQRELGVVAPATHAPQFPISGILTNFLFFSTSSSQPPAPHDTRSPPPQITTTNNPPIFHHPSISIQFKSNSKAHSQLNSQFNHDSMPSPIPSFLEPAGPSSKLTGDLSGFQRVSPPWTTPDPPCPLLVPFCLQAHYQTILPCFCPPPISPAHGG